MSDILTSRYKSDFVEIKKIGSGGFGSVYKVRNCLDENFYAIKKIYLKNNRPDFLKQILSEVQLLSSKTLFFSTAILKFTNLFYLSF
jgi:serine/threonine protein kinase